MYRKFLDEDRNPNSLDPENFWKSESDILKGLTAAYAGLQLPSNGRNLSNATL